MQMNAAILSTKRNFSITKAKPQITLTLDGDQHEAFTPSFTSLDEIKGQVSVVAQADFSFEDIYITFEGSTRTTVEKISTTSPTNGKTEAFQNFLRLVQPMDPAAFPEPRILKANQVYRFPFTFVVPERLLPQSCTHPKSDSFPEGAHLQLPPSMGDPMASAVGKTIKDDISPDMVTIAYAVKCRLVKGRGTSGKHTTVAEGARKLRIVPAVEEAPPAHVEGGDRDDFRLRKEKTIQRGIFRKKLGRLAVEAPQPKSFRLHSIHSTETCPVTTKTTLNVRFDPADDKAQPPKLGMMGVKLKVATFWTSAPMRELPTKSCDFQYSSIKSLFVDQFTLATRNLGGVEWKAHTGGDTNGHANGTSFSSPASSPHIPSPSTCYNGKTFYTAQVMVPVELPRKGNKIFLPSFNSCLVSRIYALDLNISFEPPKAAVTDPTLHLKLPIQVSCEPNPNPQRQSSTVEADELLAAQGEADAIFNPRHTGPPPGPEYLGNANITPPMEANGDQISSEGLTRVSSTSKTPVAPATSSPWRPNAVANVASTASVPRVSFAEDVPPSPGPGYSHRSSLSSTAPTGATGAIPRRGSQQVRLLDAHQRFQSLAFDDEDIAALERAQDGEAGEGDQPEATADAAADGQALDRAETQEDHDHDDDQPGEPHPQAGSDGQVQGLGVSVAPEPPPAYSLLVGSGTRWRERIVSSGASLGGRLRRLSSHGSAR